MGKPLLLRRVEFAPTEQFDPASWYLDVPVIAEVCSEGLTFERPVTVLVGENGIGKSTLVEAIAASWNAGMRGADPLWSPGGTSGDSDLGAYLRCDGVYPRPTGGGFLRAETMNSVFERADALRVRATDQVWNRLSHGQSFLHYIADRPVGQGLWLLDEPEAALSFQSCLALVGVLMDLAAEGSQVVMATHSPILAACPDAEIMELTADGVEYREWAQLDMVHDWRTFLDSPAAYLRHL
ncbi:AAA family ATPase [Nocardia sp. CDC159]|uniref:AAA family ATPase n=1 Tax=Nocardia pulmonis TaxID=2951408 RepID=A0A9X2IZA5_9NOCA|nr:MULTISPECIES: AAA family ATPase [Nocardia]MCM6775810.1 AAA family ATPase [Nocardia pulmonis]MCM6788214.1 AAA family ATPase [Nocardia sp. CDC159]